MSVFANTAKVIDTVLAPNMVMNLEGQDAYAKSLIYKVVSSPVLTSSSLGLIFFAATKSGISDIQTGLHILNEGSKGIALHALIEGLNVKTAERPKSGPYLDRTRQQDGDLDPPIEWALKELRYLYMKHAVISLTLGAAVFFPGNLSDSSSLSLNSFLAAKLCGEISGIWRCHRALTKAWMTLNSLPPKKEKKDVPAGLPQVHFQPVPVPVRP
jgi:hypothetical protein